MRIALILVLSLILTACGREREDVRQPYTPAQIIEVPVAYYVKIPAAKLAKCQWRRNLLPSQAIDASKERAKCLLTYESQFEEIDAIEGKPVPDEKP